MNNTIDIITPEDALTLPGLFQQRVTRTPKVRAYRFYDKAAESWQDKTWQETALAVASWRQALKGESLEEGDRVAVVLPNSLEWVCFDQAALALGFVVVPLYTNDRPENMAYILQETETKLLLCPDFAFWEKLLPFKTMLAGLRRIITLADGGAPSEHPQIKCASEWLEPADDESPGPSINPDTLATIVYTSGTTGRPKGVMLTHHNILMNAYHGVQCIAVFREDLFLSFLPLSHMLERTVGYYVPVMTGATVAFARSIPLLNEDLLSIRPNMMISVPRIFERVRLKILTKLKNKPAIIQKLFTMTEKVGLHRFEYLQKREKWSPVLLFWPLLDLLVARKIRARLGGRLRVVICGGAPLSTSVVQTFIGLGLPILQGYGLTETSPIISVNRLEENLPASVGPLLPGVEISIGPNEELLVRGDLVMSGYWRNQEATDQTIDENGWLHTGDRARLEDKHLYITGRVKEILVLATGEKVAPMDIEMAITRDPLFEQVMVIGEGRPYLSMLAVLNPEQYAMFAEQLGLDGTADKILESESVQEAVLEKIEEQLHAFPVWAKVRRVALTLEPWTVEQGLITPTLKLRRKSILQIFSDEVAALYEDH